ncbi:MAG: hypothetical protein IJI27_08730 [Oscillospiraceae bacterium]|nr:hypothetical protein [Oscillospiraceae bacterium]
MKKHFFLCGKNELLQKELGFSLSAAGGYVIRRVNAPGEAAKAVLMPAAAAGGVEGFACPVVLDLSNVARPKDNEVFRTEAVRIMQEAAWYPFAVLDPIGGFELVIPQYRDALAELLSSDLPILGSVLSREEAAALGASLGLGERFLMLVDRLHDALREDADTCVLDLGKTDTDAALKMLRQWMREYIF